MHGSHRACHQVTVGGQPRFCATLISMKKVTKEEVAEAKEAEEKAKAEYEASLKKIKPERRAAPAPKRGTAADETAKAAKAEARAAKEAKAAEEKAARAAARAAKPAKAGKSATSPPAPPAPSAPKSAAELREQVAKAKAELEAAKAEKAAALAEKEKLLKKPKVAAPVASLPSIGLPKFSLPMAPASSGPPPAINPFAGLAAGAALGLLPAGALIAARSWLVNGRNKFS